MNENKPTGRRVNISIGQTLMDEFRVVEAAVLAMRPCMIRDQLVDVLASYYADALREQAGGTS